MSTHTPQKNKSSRFGTDYSRHQKEFLYIFGLQASQEESDIFEEDYNVEAIATVKGLKLVSTGQIPNTTLYKIDSTNESDIDTLNISQEMKDTYHSAVQSGNIIYTP
jgi:hypothetical protein